MRASWHALSGPRSLFCAASAAVVVLVPTMVVVLGSRTPDRPVSTFEAPPPFDKSGAFAFSARDQP